jgi:hypothetical protein
MMVLERLREKLRDLGFVPMVFNFDKPETKDFAETVRLLANLSKFVIVDITNSRSAPLELQATVPDYPLRVKRGQCCASASGANTPVCGSRTDSNPVPTAK